MKNLIPFIAAAALAAPGISHAETAYSKPSGYVTLGNPDSNAAIPDITANTDATVSIPLERAPEYSGKISSVSGSNLVLDTNVLPVSGLAGDPATPYQFKITSGSQEGLIGLISANTANSVNLGSIIVGDLSGVSANDTFVISKAWTLGTFFPSTLPAGTNVLAYSGTVAGSNLASDLAFVWSGTSWFQISGADNGLENDSNTILFPGESFIVRSGGAPIDGFVVTGNVPLTKSRALITKINSNAQDNRISITSPVDEPIENLRGMLPGDNLLTFDNSTSGINKSASEVLVWSGTAWFGVAGVSGDQTGLYKLKSGQGYVLRRSAGAPIGDGEISIEQNYLDDL
ncbi:TIGR02597 family protein [Luteolibacter algae]|uniref:TIGR02597 family protein n=1 Tax=Luteolibacter algae TaxID=454151 RepID=A0ABW5DA59_9BACT